MPRAADAFAFERTGFERCTAMRAYGGERMDRSVAANQHDRNTVEIDAHRPAFLERGFVDHRDVVGRRLDCRRGVFHSDP